MSSPIEAAIASIRHTSPSITLHTPSSADYEALRKTYVVTGARPAAIARPRSAEEVAALVRACAEHGAELGVRAGGHSCVGRALLDGGLTVDVREIDHVVVADDEKTARVGGGVLAGGLLKALGERGLATPCGSVGSVGYVGWSTLGGYGPFSSLHGLGVDQIVGARLVTSRGEIVDAGEDLLKGIRGAGPIFGPIVELTIKVHPLKELLVGTLIYDSSDMKAIWTTVTQNLQTLTLPDPLQIQLFATDFPGAGKVLGAIATWVSDDHAQGREWIDRIAGLGTCVMNATATKTPQQYAADNEQIAPYGVHGRSYTLSVRAHTAETAAVLAKHSARVPAGGCMISVHSLRGPKPSDLGGGSVFGAREPHHVIEIVAMGTDPALEQDALAWGRGLLADLRARVAADNVVRSSYISLLDYDDADVADIYNEHLPALVALKSKYDPGNVFRNAAPRLPAQ